jgi:hypothetical protein
VSQVGAVLRRIFQGKSAISFQGQFQKFNQFGKGKIGFLYQFSFGNPRFASPLSYFHPNKSEKVASGAVF